MSATIIKLGPNDGTADAIRQAREVMRGGGLVVFPTDTVYGVGASSGAEAAVRRLRELKKINEDQALTVHISQSAQLAPLGVVATAVGQRLMKKGWPGPLTLIFRVADVNRAAVHQRLSDVGRRAVYAGANVGVRCPDSAGMADLFAPADDPIVASSANMPGAAVTVDGATAIEQLSAHVDLIIDAGRTRYARASTVVNVDDNGYQVVREGVYDARTVKRLASLNILFVCTGNTCRSPMAAGICSQLIAQRLGVPAAALAEQGITISSSGVGAYDGAAASDGAVVEMQSRDIDITRHRSRRLTPELVHAADHVFTMTAGHSRAVLDMVPAAEARVRPLDPDGEDIIDPLGGEDADYAACAAHIANAISHWLEEIDL